MSLSSKVGMAWAAAVLLCLAGCNQSPQSKAPAPRPPSQASQQWKQTADGFVQSYFAAQPVLRRAKGKHEYDGQLPDVSAHGIKREIARLHDRARPTQRRRSEPTRAPGAIRPRLSSERRRPRSVLPGEDALPLHQSLLVLDGDIDPDMYLSRNYAPLNVRMKAYIKYARGIPKMASDIQDEPQRPVAQDLRRARHRGLRRLRGFLQEGRRGGVRLGQRSGHAEGHDGGGQERRQRDGEPDQFI